MQFTATHAHSGQRLALGVHRRPLRPIDRRTIAGRLGVLEGPFEAAVGLGTMDEH